jgi:hypothetical protein
MSQETAKSYDPRRNFQKKVSFVDYSDSEDEDNMIGLAEWVKGKKTVSCPFGKKEPEKFGFDITKVYKIFDLLLQQGQIKLSQFHTIPSAEELMRMKIGHGEGHWRCSFSRYCWEDEIKLPTAENCPECNGAYNNSNLSKRVCFNDGRLAARDHRDFSNQRISVHDRLGAKPTYTIGWGARLVFMVGWEAESMKSQTIGWKRWPILWSLMETSCAELLNVDARYN